MSQTGQPCLSWADSRIRHVLAQSSRSAVTILDRNAARSTIRSTSSTPSNAGRPTLSIYIFLKHLRLYRNLINVFMVRWFA